jgi:hypothetical protein
MSARGAAERREAAPIVRRSHMHPSVVHAALVSLSHRFFSPRVQMIPAWTSQVTTVNVAARSNYRAAPRASINEQANFRATQVATVPAIMPDGTIGRMVAPAPPAGTAAAKAPARVVGLSGPLSANQVLFQSSAEVLGRSRVKFFKRPVIPFLGAPEAMLQSSSMDADAAAQQQAAQQAQQPQVVELTRTRGTQSEYRESDTQTDPYTPDYITSPEEAEPEILGLAHLTYGAGLPASMDELTLIQRMREKKAFEASLPPITDAASFELRKRMLERRELAEWALREEEMKAEQGERLHILMASLQARENKLEELGEARIDAVRQDKMRERDRAFDAIHRERIKLHRALGKKREELDESTAHMSGGGKELTSSHTSNRRTGLRDIVADYADHASQVYAPVQRRGKLPVRNQVVDYGIPLIANFQGLTELEASLPANATTAAVRPPEIRVKSLATRKGQAIRADLDYVDSLLVLQRGAGGAVGIAGDAKAHYGRSRALAENVYKKFEPVQRAPTPTVAMPEAEESARAILLLQRLLRGRMVQNAMYEGKQHHRALIQELRVTENPPEETEIDEDEVSNRCTRIDTRQHDGCDSVSAHALACAHLSLLTSSLLLHRSIVLTVALSSADVPRARHAARRAHVDRLGLRVEGGRAHGAREPCRRSRAPGADHASPPRGRGERSSTGGGTMATEAIAATRGGARCAQWYGRSLPRRVVHGVGCDLRRAAGASPRGREVGRARYADRVDRDVAGGIGCDTAGVSRSHREHSRRPRVDIPPPGGREEEGGEEEGTQGSTIHQAGARGRIPRACRTAASRHDHRVRSCICTGTSRSGAAERAAVMHRWCTLDREERTENRARIL